MEFKGKEDRNKCYTARDDYFRCLDDQASCEDLFKKFEQLCGHKWTEHFLRKRNYENFKKRQELEGDILDRMKK